MTASRLNALSVGSRVEPNGATLPLAATSTPTALDCLLQQKALSQGNQSVRILWRRFRSPAPTDDDHRPRRNPGEPPQLAGVYLRQYSVQLPSANMVIMRLAFVSIEDPEDPHVWSGTPYFMLNAIRKQGVGVEVIAPLSQRAKYLLAPAKLTARLHNQGLHLDRRSLVLKSYARQIERRLAAHPCDAILSPSSIPIAMLPRGAPAVFWTDAVFDAMRGYSWGAFRNYSDSEASLAHQQEAAALERASYAVYSNEWSANAAARHYQVPKEKIQMVRFGANLPIGHGRQQIEEWMKSRGHEPCRLLLIGVNWPQKGGPIALEATEILRKRGIAATLVVAGCETPASPWIESHGFISKQTTEGRERLAQLLSQATLFLLPTRAEAAGIVFCEASAFGLPIVTTATGGVESYVRNGVNGYCLPYKATAADYADQIQTLLGDANLYRRLSLDAYEEFTTGLNWDAAVSRVIELLERAVHQARAGSITSTCLSPS